MAEEIIKESIIICLTFLANLFASVSGGGARFIKYPVLIILGISLEISVPNIKWQCSFKIDIAIISKLNFDIASLKLSLNNWILYNKIFLRWYVAKVINTGLLHSKKYLL